MVRLSAENHELRFLEEEAEQMRAGRALREEQERLEQQRRAVLLLQQSLRVPIVGTPQRDKDIASEKMRYTNTQKGKHTRGSLQIGPAAQRSHKGQN